jgi:superfamily II DNA or RNA helicase
MAPVRRRRGQRQFQEGDPLTSHNAAIQSLYRKEDVKDFVAEYGQVIVDECHHISTTPFEHKVTRRHTEFRTEHLQYFATKLAGAAKHVFVLKGGMGKKQRRATAAALASAPENESRVILATGSYIGEGFDDARLDTLFVAMLISWKSTLQQYVGRLHRLHDSKRSCRSTIMWTTTF